MFKVHIILVNSSVNSNLLNSFKIRLLFDVEKYGKKTWERAEKKTFRKITKTRLYKQLTCARVYFYCICVHFKVRHDRVETQMCILCWNSLSSHFYHIFIQTFVIFIWTISKRRQQTKKKLYLNNMGNMHFIFSKI